MWNCRALLRDRILKAFEKNAKRKYGGGDGGGDSGGADFNDGFDDGVSEDNWAPPSGGAPT